MNFGLPWLNPKRDLACNEGIKFNFLFKRAKIVKK